MTPIPPLTPVRRPTAPTPGEEIFSSATGNTYTIADKIGEGAFGIVFACRDVWQNDLAAKVLKPVGTYEAVRAAAVGEFDKLLRLRNPHVTFVYDAFEYRDTFYIITERCYCPISSAFNDRSFDTRPWLLPVARSLLQAVHYLHRNGFVHQDIHADNVFASLARNEVLPSQPGSIQFKLGDLGVAKLVTELSHSDLRAKWLLPPEILDSTQFGPLDSRIDIYHAGLLLLQLAHSRVLRFSQEEILAGKPRDLALALPAPYCEAIEKTLRRHSGSRTADAMVVWRELNGSR